MDIIRGMDIFFRSLPTGKLPISFISNLFPSLIVQLPGSKLCLLLLKRHVEKPHALINVPDLCHLVIGYDGSPS